MKKLSTWLNKFSFKHHTVVYYNNTWCVAYKIHRWSEKILLAGFTTKEDAERSVKIREAGENYVYDGTEPKRVYDW